MYTKTFFSRAVAVLLCLTISIAALYFGRALFVPLLTALLLACLVLPMVRNLESLRLSRSLAALAGVLLVVGSVMAIASFLWMELGGFYRNIDEVLLILNEQVDSLQRFAPGTLALPADRSEAWMDLQKMRLFSWIAELTFSLLGARENALTRALLVPFFMFFILLYRNRLTVFLNHHQDPATQLDRTDLTLVQKLSTLAQQYVGGVLTIALLTWIGAATAFYGIGLDHALVAGLIFAIFNVIPYIGFLVGAIFPLLIAFMQHADPSLAVAVIAICIFLHLLDLNLLTPTLLRTCLALNPLTIMLALIAGGLLWGLAGLVLSVLSVSVVKIVCDHVPGWRPFGYLLGDEVDYGPGLPSRTTLVLPDQ